jgi:hypothetical protein
MAPRTRMPAARWVSAGLGGALGTIDLRGTERQRAAAVARPVAVALRCGGDLRPPLDPKKG